MLFLRSLTWFLFLYTVFPPKTPKLLQNRYAAVVFFWVPIRNLHLPLKRDLVTVATTGRSNNTRNLFSCGHLERKMILQNNWLVRPDTVNLLYNRAGWRLRFSSVWFTRTRVLSQYICYSHHYFCVYGATSPSQGLLDRSQ